MCANNSTRIIKRGTISATTAGHHWFVVEPPAGGYRMVSAHLSIPEDDTTNGYQEFGFSGTYPMSDGKVQFLYWVNDVPQNLSWAVIYERSDETDLFVDGDVSAAF